MMGYGVVYKFEVQYMYDLSDCITVSNIMI